MYRQVSISELIKPSTSNQVSTEQRRQTHISFWMLTSVTLAGNCMWVFGNLATMSLCCVTVIEVLSLFYNYELFKHAENKKQAPTISQPSSTDVSLPHLPLFLFVRLFAQVSHVLYLCSRITTLSGYWFNNYLLKPYCVHFEVLVLPLKCVVY